MNPIKIFARVDTEGKIAVPLPLQRATGLKKGQLIELKVVGVGKKKILTVSAKNNAR